LEEAKKSLWKEGRAAAGGTHFLRHLNLTLTGIQKVSRIESFF